MYRVPFFDLTTQYSTIEKEIITAITEFLPKQQLILGETVDHFEKSLASYCQSHYAIGVSSGTDALAIALEAIEIGPGDDVIVPAFTYFSSASVITRRRANIIFCDIDPLTYNLDPRHLEAIRTPHTRAIIPVHLFGHPAALPQILPWAERHNIAIIEDVAQAIGAEIHGARVGSFGKMAALSFYPTKNLGAFGDAGAITTQIETLATRLRMIRSQGSQHRYIHEAIGGAYRLDAIQALILSIKLPHLENWQKARQHHAAHYHKHLADIDAITLPFTQEGYRHVFHQYVIRVKERDQLRAHLQNRGIGTEIYYPRALPDQPIFQKLGYTHVHCPEARKAAQEVLALPIYPELNETSLDAVVKAIKEFYKAL